VKVETLKRLNLKEDDEVYVKVRGHKRRVHGLFKGETLITGISLYSGCEAIKVFPIRKGVVRYYTIMPICAIQELKVNGKVVEYA